MVGLEDSVSPTTGIYSHTTDYNGMFKELIDKISELESLYNGGWVEWQEITDEIDELGRLIDRFSGEPMSVTVTQRRDERTTLKIVQEKELEEILNKSVQKKELEVGVLYPNPESVIFTDPCYIN